MAKGKAKASAKPKTGIDNKKVVVSGSFLDIVQAAVKQANNKSAKKAMKWE